MNEKLSTYKDTKQYINKTMKCKKLIETCMLVDLYIQKYINKTITYKKLIETCTLVDWDAVPM